MLRKILFVFAILLSPVFLFAHVKWFAEEKIPTPFYTFSDVWVWVAIILSLLIVCLGSWLDKKLKTPEWFKKFSEQHKAQVLSLASIGFGTSFLIFAYKGFVFAPNLVPSSEWSFLLIILEAIAGAMILFGFYERLGGGLIILIFVLAIKEFGFLEMMDALEIVGFAFYAIILGRPKWKIKDADLLSFLKGKVEDLAVPILRVGTGLNLMILGFSEKILAPSLTENFLSRYDWNFMQNLGFSQFSDYWFAFAGGVVEVLFGVFLILGLLTRLTTLALAVFLTTTLVLLGPVELIGHLPHFSIAIVLLMLGAGNKLRMHKGLD